MTMRTLRIIVPGAGLACVAIATGCFNPSDLDLSGASQTDSDATDSAAPGSGTTGLEDESSDTSTADTSTSEALTSDAPTSNASTRGTSSTDGGSTSEETGTSGDGGTSTGACVGAGCPCFVDEPCESGLSCEDDVCVAAGCGDGTLDVAREQCDDGNLNDGDGCQNDCTRTEFTIAAGFWSTCALIEGGEVRCWGYNFFGQLGYGHTDNLGLAVHPWQIPEVELPGPAAEVSVGERFICARIGAGDDVVCWGAGFNGMLGTGNEDDETDPALLPPINLGAAGSTALGTGGRHSCSLNTDGDTRCWGRGNLGQLGYGNTNDIGDNEDPVSAGVVSGGSIAIGLGVGNEHTCVVLSDGTIRCWGENNRAQAGAPVFGDVGDNELPSAFPAIDFGTPATKVVLGRVHTCALLSDGSVQCWGDANLGRLGDGNNSTGTIGRDQPVTSVPPVPLGSPAIDIAAGSSHTCALLEGGDIVCWGANNNGQLGTGDTENVGDDETPASVGPIDLPSAVVQMAVGGEHTCAVLDDSRVFCWGFNGLGQLGLAVNEGDVLAPTQAPPVQIFEPSE